MLDLNKCLYMVIVDSCKFSFLFKLDTYSSRGHLLLSFALAQGGYLNRGVYSVVLLL